MIDESLLEGGSVCLSLYLSFEKCHFLTWTHLLFHVVEGRSWACVRWAGGRKLLKTKGNNLVIWTHEIQYVHQEMGPCSLEGIYCLPQEIVCVLVVYLKMEIWVATCLPNFALFLNFNHRFKRRIYMEDKNVRINRLLGEHLRLADQRCQTSENEHKKNPSPNIGGGLHVHFLFQFLHSTSMTDLFQGEMWIAFF